MTRRVSLLVAVVFAAVAPMIAVGPSFIPDVTFQGSSLAGWHTVGQAEWKAENGEIVGRPTAASGGWLVLDRSYQDVGVYLEYRCAAGCVTGVLFRGEKTMLGMKGTLVELSDPDVPTYTVTIGADGKIDGRDRLHGVEVGWCGLLRRLTRRLLRAAVQPISVRLRRRRICRSRLRMEREAG